MIGFTVGFERKYDVIILNDDGTYYKKTHSLRSLTTRRDDDFEYVYAIQENYADRVLSMEFGECFVFGANRDNSNETGIIVRIA
jgi:hypothetical protein